MIKLLLYKWFGIEPTPCATCEVLRLQLGESNRERKELLHKLLDKGNTEPPLHTEESPIPITSQNIPWRVRKGILEAEDKKAAELLRQRSQEIRAVGPTNERIESLEKELGVVAGEQ